MSVKSNLELIIQALRGAAHDAGSFLIRTLSGEWNEFISRVIDDFNVLSNATSVLGPGSSRYRAIYDFLHEIATVLVRLDNKVLNDFELLSRLGKVFQDALDYVADLSIGSEKCGEDFSQDVFQLICESLGAPPDPAITLKEFVFEVPSKHGSRVKLFQRIRRLLKAIAKHEFKCLSQTHILNVTICEALIQFVEFNSSFAKLSSVLSELMVSKDDPLQFEFQHRAMQIEFQISQYLTQLMLLDAQSLLGETPDFTSLQPLAESLSEDLTFDVNNISSQSGIYRKLLEILGKIPVDFTLSIEDKEELLQLSVTTINQPPKIVNAVGLVPAIRFLTAYFSAFSGKSEDFTKFSKALWIWCDFLSAIPNHSPGLAFLRTKLKGRLKDLISEPQNYRIHFPKLLKILQKASETIELLASIDQCAKIPQKYAILASDLEKVAEDLEATDLREVKPIVLTVFRCSILKLRLFVLVPELETFAVCCHNLLYLEVDEILEGLQQLLTSIIPSFPTSLEMKTQVRSLITKLTNAPAVTPRFSQGVSFLT
jgi:hypothetical protein